MSGKDDKITWITCPDCGSKIGIVLSIGKQEATQIIHERMPTTETTPQNYRTQLEAAGVDLSLLDIEENETSITISPKKFLGEQWGSINDAIRGIGGNWIRDGKSSRWELVQQTQD